MLVGVRYVIFKTISGKDANYGDIILLIHDNEIMGYDKSCSE